MKILGIDPGLTATGWCCLYKNLYDSSGTIHHGIRGRGRWERKIEAILQKTLEEVRQINPEWIIIEKPHYGTRGKQRGVAAMVALMATMDLAWTLAFYLQKSWDVQMMTPDSRSKSTRSMHLARIIQEFPTRTNEHVRDAAWLVLRGLRLA